jgi:hypothetical protein
MSVGICLSAQTHSFRFFPIDSISLIYQGFVGNIGSRFFLLNKANRNELDLNVYDTVTRTTVNHRYKTKMDLISVLVHETSISFIGVAPAAEGKMPYYYLEVNEQGELIHKKEGVFVVLNTPLRSVTSSDGKHVLFFQYARKNSDSIYIQGSMVGAGGRLEKELSYSFKEDRERASDPEAFIDNAGNTHVIVYDKYNNYRLSTDVIVNSVYFPDDEIVSEAFTLEKIKLRTMRVFQNERKNCIQLEGLYADGRQKDRVITGLYSISLPFERKNELLPKFLPISTEMIKAFKKGYSATDATIRNSLQLKDWIYSDSGSLVIFNLNFNFLVNPGSEIPEGARGLRPATGGAGGLGAVPPMLITDAKAWNAPKQIVLKMGQEQGIEWHFVQKLDLFRMGRMNYNNVFLLNGEEEKISMVLYQSDEQEQPYPALISVKNGKQVIEKFPEKELVFSPVQYLRNNQFGSLYMNMGTGEAGIMVVHSKR